VRNLLLLAAPRTSPCQRHSGGHQTGGIIGSILGRGLTHMFSRPPNERYHPAGVIVSILGAILVLFICFKLKIHFPQVNPF
jgi:Transglycosylase associated protein